MAWRIEEQVVRGEIDNRTPGRVVGKIWLAGRDEAVELELEGNPWRDLAGHVLKFSNPDAKPVNGSELTAYQNGMVGDMTASRKVKVPDCTMDELMEFFEAKQPFPWHWGNSLYLEWYSITNGRVVIEAAHYQLELDVEPAWILTEKEEIARQAVVDEALAKFMERNGMEMTVGKLEDDDDDQPQSWEEARADEEDAQDEHPLREIVNSVSNASAKLAGALGMAARYDEWPPERSIAGNVIVRLKKARGYLRDALRGIESAEEEALATQKWRHQTQLKVIDILAQTDTLLREVREVLNVVDDDDDLGIF